MNDEMGETASIKVIDNEDWSFRGADTKYLTHGLHPYPARMIPQISRRLLERYASRGDVILDPFCGSGTVLVEARLHGVNSIGFDINPLACLLASIKSTPIDPLKIRKCWKTLKARVGEKIAWLKFRQVDVAVPDFTGTNIEYWYKPETMKELTIIRNELMQIRDDETRMFFDVPFSITARKVSGTRKGEFKLLRIPEDKWRKFSPNVYETFVDCVEDAIRRMEEFYKRCDRRVFSRVFMADARKMLSREFPEEANKLLAEKPPKIIITSPPYGDSRTTVAYGQFSRLSALWLDFEKGFDRNTIMAVDKISLGGDPRKMMKVDLPILHSVLELIREKDNHRRSRDKEVASFFSDLYACLEKMYEVLLGGGYCCIVIANRTVRRVQIPTHLIIAEMGVKVGFNRDVVIIPRDIPTKRLPWENAPENIPGLKGRTMSRENIVIMRKQD